MANGRCDGNRRDNGVGGGQGGIGTGGIQEGGGSGGVGRESPRSVSEQTGRRTARVPKGKVGAVCCWKLPSKVGGNDEDGHQRDGGGGGGGRGSGVGVRHAEERPELTTSPC